MDITPYVESLRRDLTAAVAGTPAADSADRLLVALEPAMRLVVMEVLAQAAAEITAELPAGVVEVRLRGRDPQVVVDVPPAPPQVERNEPPAAGAEADTDEEAAGEIARVSLRIPESVKQRAEDLAARSGHSLNGWIVSVLRAATSRHAVNVDVDLSSIPLGGERGRRMTGWV